MNALTLVALSMPCVHPSKAARWISGWRATRHVPAATYMYNFDYAPSDEIVHQVATKAGACHSCEIPSVFNNQLYLHTEIELKLGKSIASMWSAFASTGNPSTPDLQWTPFQNVTSEHAAVLGPALHMATDLFKARCDLFDDLPYTDPN